MIIKHIHIDNFGKLKNFDLAPGDNFTILYGNNEDGKSTLMAFIYLMFYGTSGRSQDISKNPRKRYKPWDGSEMKGYIDFLNDGKTYRLERVFAASNATDIVNIWNMDKGEQISLPRDKDPGQEFFNLGAEAFEKSVFIGQGGSVIDDGGKKDEITQRLLNMVTTGDESISYKVVDTNLKNMEEKLVSKNEKKGMLVNNRRVLDNLNLLKTQAEIDEQEKAEQIRQIKEKQRQKEIIEKDKRAFEKKAQKYELIDRVKIYEKALMRKKELAELIKLQKNRKADLIREDAVLDEVFISEFEQMIKQLENSEILLKEAKLDYEHQKNIAEELAQKEVEKISSENFEQLKYKIKEVEKIKVQIIDLKKQVESFEYLEKLEQEINEFDKELTEIAKKTQMLTREAEDLIGNCKEYNEQLDALNDQIEENRQKTDYLRHKSYSVESELKSAQSSEQNISDNYDERIRYLKDRLTDANKPHQLQEQMPEKKELRKPVLLISLAIIMAGIVLGVILEPYFFLIMLVALIPFPLLYKKIPASTIIRNIIDTDLINDCKEKIVQEERDYVARKEQAKNKTAEIKQEFEQIKADLEEEQQLRINLQKQLKAAQQEAEIASGNYDAKLRQLEGLNGQKETLLKQKSIRSRERMEKIESETVYSQLEEKIDPETTRKALFDLKEKIDEIIERKTVLLSAVQSELINYRADDFDHLAELYQIYNLHQDKIKNQLEIFKKAEAKHAALENQVNEKKQNLIDKIMLYEPAVDVNQAFELFDKLKSSIAEIERAEININTYIENQSDLEKDFTQEKLAEQIEQINNEISKLDIVITNIQGEAEIVTDDNSEEKSQLVLKSKIKALNDQIITFSQEIASEEASIKERFRDKKNISQLEEEISEIREVISAQEDDYQAIKLAKKTLEESFEDIQKNFGPLVNNKTAEIFNVLTNGKYNNVKVSRKFDIAIEDSKDNRLHEWRFLSSGTIDQAYLSLRLAISSLLTQNSQPLPLLLDDIFTQYDDDRAFQGLRFLQKYREENSSVAPQIIMFSCHKRLVDWAEKDIKEIEIKKLS